MSNLVDKDDWVLNVTTFELHYTMSETGDTLAISNNFFKLLFFYK